MSQKAIRKSDMYCSKCSGKKVEVIKKQLSIIAVVNLARRQDD